MLETRVTRVEDQECHEIALQSRTYQILHVFRRERRGDGESENIYTVTGVDRYEIWVSLVGRHKRKRHGKLIGRRGTRETCDLIKSLPFTLEGVKTKSPTPRRVISLVSTRRRS